MLSRQGDIVLEDELELDASGRWAARDLMPGIIEARKRDLLEGFIINPVIFSSRIFNAESVKQIRRQQHRRIELVDNFVNLKFSVISAQPAVVYSIGDRVGLRFI